MQHGWRADRDSPRVILAVIVATVLTGAIALLLYGVLFQIPPSQLVFGPVNEQNIFVVSVTVLVVAGLFMYWVSWRLLVGFDLGSRATYARSAAARWVLLGLAVLLVTFIAGAVALITALGPV